MKRTMLKMKNSGVRSLTLCLVLVCLFAGVTCAQARETVCRTYDEIVSYLQPFLQAKERTITFYFDSSLYDKIDDRDWMTDLVYDVGIAMTSWSYSNTKCTLKNIEYIDAVHCSTESEVLSALVNAKGGSVNLFLSKDLYARLAANGFSALKDIEGHAGLMERDMSYYNESYRVIEYKNMQFAKNFARLSTEDELRKYLTARFNAKDQSFSFYCTVDLYNTLKPNSFSRLDDFQGFCGIKSRHMSYYDNKRIIEFSDVKYVENFARLSTEEELKRYLTGRVNEMDDAFGFYCTADLYKRLKQEDFDLPDDILKNLGMLTRDMTYYDSTRILLYNQAEYFPGKRIVWAVENNATSGLSRQDQQLFQLAFSLANEAKVGAADEYQLIMNIHKAITPLVRYQEGPENGDYSDHDTAVGALLNGYAECDGYADAFYLVGNLAGLDVHYQRGDSLQEEEGEDTGHLWNVIVLGGKNYFVDLTWDDAEKGAHFGYTNIGRDIAQHCYTWDSRAVFYPLADTTDSANYYYTREGCAFTAVAQAQEYIRQQVKSGSGQFVIMLTHDGTSGASAVLDALLAGVNVGASYSYSDVGNYIFIIVTPK